MIIVCDKIPVQIVEIRNFSSNKVQELSDFDLSKMSFVSISNGEDKNVSNATTIPKTLTKSSVRLHGPPTKAKVGSGTIEE
jgi:hypothetical protein